MGKRVRAIRAKNRINIAASILRRSIDRSDVKHVIKQHRVWPQTILNEVVERASEVRRRKKS